MIKVLSFRFDLTLKYSLPGYVFITRWKPDAHPYGYYLHQGSGVHVKPLKTLQQESARIDSIHATF